MGSRLLLWLHAARTASTLIARQCPRYSASARILAVSPPSRPSACAEVPTDVSGFMVVIGASGQLLAARIGALQVGRSKGAVLLCPTTSCKGCRYSCCGELSRGSSRCTRAGEVRISRGTPPVRRSMVIPFPTSSPTAGSARLQRTPAKRMSCCLLFAPRLDGRRFPGT
jgi:hypothetical protein